LDQITAFANEVGMHYLICPSPVHKHSNRKAGSGGSDPEFTLEDWRWSAEQFNQIGKKVHAAGLKFGFHNHRRAFQKQNGVVPYDELMRLTDPTYVTMEMDCGWVVVGGGNPVDLLRRYPTRISMLHVKDFKDIDRSSIDPKPPVPVELGQGEIDYAPIFRAAAETGNVKHVFVEQEAFDMPPMASLKVDADYLRKLGVI
jgi:sugar phosphate isomerase/epimerase